VLTECLPTVVPSPFSELMPSRISSHRFESKIGHAWTVFRATQLDKPIYQVQNHFLQSQSSVALGLKMEIRLILQAPGRNNNKWAAGKNEEGIDRRVYRFVAHKRGKTFICNLQ